MERTEKASNMISVTYSYLPIPQCKLIPGHVISYEIINNDFKYQQASFSRNNVMAPVWHFLRCQVKDNNICITEILQTMLTMSPLLDFSLFCENTDIIRTGCEQGLNILFRDDY